jgi:predicted ATPase
MQAEKATARSVLDRCRRSMGWASDVFHPEAHLNTLRPRGAASVYEKKIRLLKARENTHSGTRASGASSQELSAQLAGETCSVIDVSNRYPV